MVFAGLVMTSSFVSVGAAAQSDSLATLEIGGAVCGVPQAIKRLPRGLELDSEWLRFAPALRGCRVLNRRNTWVAECAWFHIVGEDARVYRMEELDSLYAQGRVSESSHFTAARYRYLIHAGSRDEAARVAAKQWPTRAPEAVRKMLIAQDSWGRDSSSAAAGSDRH